MAAGLPGERRPKPRAGSPHLANQKSSAPYLDATQLFRKKKQRKGVTAVAGEKLDEKKKKTFHGAFVSFFQYFCRYFQDVSRAGASTFQMG